MAEHIAENRISSDGEGPPQSPADSAATPPPRSADESSSDEEDVDSYDEESSDNETDPEDPRPYIEEDPQDLADPRAKVLTVLELEDLFAKSAPDLSGNNTFTSECQDPAH